MAGGSGLLKHNKQNSSFFSSFTPPSKYFGPTGKGHVVW